MTSDGEHPTTNNDDESQRVALVTGGSRGIGRAAVEALAGEGWRVFFCSLNQGSVDEAAAAFGERYGDRVHGTAVDARDQTAVDAWVSRVEDEAGGIDCLVNNAGLGVFGPVDEISGEDWRRVIDTNLSGAFYFMSAVARGMRARGGGWIFNIASLAGKNPFAGGAAYNASKFGLVGMSEAAMLDLRHDGVRVTAILPGSVATDFFPAGSTGDWMLAPEDVARTVVDCLRYPDRALPSRIELRPSQPRKG